MKIKYYLLIGIICLGLFYGWSLMVKESRLTKINFDVSVKLQDKVPARFDEILEEVSLVVSPVLSVGWLIVLTLLVVINIPAKKIHPLAMIIPLLFFLMIGAELVGKIKVESPGPPFFMLKNPITIFPSDHVQEAYSYPSGHAARALFLAGLVFLIVGRTKKRTWLLLSLVVGLGGVLLLSLAKVYLGHHWVADSVGGWIIALGFLAFSYAASIPSLSWQTIKQRLVIKKRKSALA